MTLRAKREPGRDSAGTGTGGGMKRVEYTGSFRAVDQFGGEHVIDVYTTFVHAGDPGNPGAEVRGMSDLVLADGRRLSRTPRGGYQTFDGRLNLWPLDCVARPPA
jgi:hypothetical protein